MIIKSIATTLAIIALAAPALAQDNTPTHDTGPLYHQDFGTSSYDKRQEQKQEHQETQTPASKPRTNDNPYVYEAPPQATDHNTDLENSKNALQEDIEDRLEDVDDLNDVNDVNLTPAEEESLEDYEDLRRLQEGVYQQEIEIDIRQ